MRFLYRRAAKAQMSRHIYVRSLTRAFAPHIYKAGDKNSTRLLVIKGEI